MRAVGMERRLPEQDAREPDGPEDGAQGEARDQLSPDDAEPVAQPYLAQRHRADDERRRLRARVAAAGNDQGHEEREHQRFVDLFLEEAHRGGREHLAEEERRQPARALLDHAADGDREVGLSERLAAAHLLDVLGRFFRENLHHVVGGDDSLHVSGRIDDGQRHEAAALEDARDRLLIELVGHGDDVRAHQVAHELVARRGHQLAKAHHAEERLVRPQHVGVVDRLQRSPRLPAKVGDRFVGRHLRPQPGEARAHPSARAVLRVCEQRDHVVARVVVEQREELLALGRGRDLLKQVRRVVRRQDAHPGAPLGLGQVTQKPHLLPRPEREEQILRYRAREEAQAVGPLVEGQRRPRLAQLALRECAAGRPHQAFAGMPSGTTVGSRKSSAALKSASSRSRIGLPLSERTRLNTSMTWTLCGRTADRGQAS